MNKRPFIASLLMLACIAAGAQDVRDTLQRAVVTSKSQRQMLETLGGVSGKVNVEKIRAVPSFLGNADPIRFARLLPSVQVNTESDGGIYMQGSEYSHTLLSIQGVPVYGASHLLGFFSVFNPTHYQSMDYSTSAEQSTRLGGSIDMILKDRVPARTEGEFSAGLLSFQGTVDIPTGAKSALTLSGRKSYINLLYGSFLKYDGEPLTYGFFDSNITWYWKPSAKDRVWVNLFGGKDDGRFEYTRVNSDMGASWYNALASVHWNHYNDNIVLKQTLYGTMNGLDAFVTIPNASGTMPSFIQSYGYKARLEQGGWEAGADIAYHRAMPQNPEAEGHYNVTNTSSESMQDGLETKIYLGYKKLIGYYTELKAALGGSWYLSPERESFWGLTPQAEASFIIPRGGKISLRYGISRQVLFQTGITNTGLPIEFWILAGKLSRPQWAHNYALAYNIDFGRKDEWALSAETYYKQLHNQLEYHGTIMEVLNSNYSIEQSLLQGHGRAYGINMMLQKNAGALTGWISYAYGRSLRNFNNPLYPGTYPSNHERLHELKIIGTYDIGRFDFGGSFFACTGTPYTRPDSFYIVGDRVICNYGEHNAARLPAYVRLDISVNWYFHKDARRRNGLNFSMYNVLGRRNAVGYGVHLNEEDYSYNFMPTSYGVRFLPSLAYFHKF